MKFLIVVLIFAFILLPILKLRLKPKQKQQLALRQRAINNGLLVQFASTPAPREAIEPGQSIRYSYMFNAEQQKCIVDNSLYQWIRPSANDQNRPWRLKQKPLNTQQLERIESGFNAIFKTLPDSVNAVELSNDHLGCYWYEQGDVDDAAQLCASLLQLKEHLFKQLEKQPVIDPDTDTRT